MALASQDQERELARRYVRVEEERAARAAAPQELVRVKAK